MAFQRWLWDNEYKWNRQLGLVFFAVDRADVWAGIYEFEKL